MLRAKVTILFSTFHDPVFGRCPIAAGACPLVVRWFSACGHDAAHVADKGMQAATDRMIWDFAVTEGWIIVTKDEDFAQRKIMTQAGLAIVWLRWPNTRRQELHVRFEEALPVIVAALSRGATMIEVV